MTRQNVIALILAGGQGKRLWPLSTRERPKQFCNLIDVKSMLQLTVDRIVDLIPMDRIFVCTASGYVKLVTKQLPDLPEKNIIIEPFGKNTAAAIAYSNLIMDLRFPDAVSVVLSADHYINGMDAFHDAIMEGVDLAGKSNRALDSLGIVPIRPHT